jgi:hypothetical protein
MDASRMGAGLVSCRRELFNGRERYTESIGVGKRFRYPDMLICLIVNGSGHRDAANDDRICLHRIYALLLRDKTRPALFIPADFPKHKRSP